MADLGTLVTGLGHTDVSTYIQSGNVLFTAPDDADCAVTARVITEAIAATLGVTAPVVVVTRGELARILADNPFPDEPDPRRVHAVVLSEPPWPELTVKLDAARASPPPPAAPMRYSRSAARSTCTRRTATGAACSPRPCCAWSARRSRVRPARHGTGRR